MVDEAAVAIVGGGPAGAALATRLAHSGVSTIVFERSAEPKWRACGVFSSPLTLSRLIDLGLTQAQVADLSRPISALALGTTSGATCRIEYRHGHAGGFDRVQLDGAMLDRARDAGADVRVGRVVQSVGLPRATAESGWLRTSATGPNRDGGAQTVRARFIVGADGPNSVVARAAGVMARPRLSKAGLTFHMADPQAAPAGQPMTGRFVFGKGWYVGIAPVPGDRVNIGIVMPRGLLAEPLDVIAARLIGQIPGPSEPWMSAQVTDSYAAAGRLSHRVTRNAGAGFLLVGDACGFIDPLTGEGLHRALVSAELAADAITGWLRGDARAMDDYDRRLRGRFRTKDVVSWVLQAFLAQPALLDYALLRLARRDRVRETLTLVLTDQIPASRALDPRFMARLLAP